MMRKTALFGGTFDPVHNGHVEVAQFAAEKIGAEKVILVPAKRSPHKNSKPIACAEDRIKMISLAIAGRDNFEISDCEITRPEPSYTLDTVEYFRGKYDYEGELYLLIGADSLEDFAKWYKVMDLIDICNICVMLRAGVERPDFAHFVQIFGQRRSEKLSKNVIETPLINISSTDIRNKIAARQNVEKMVCPDVLKYITENGLYTNCV